MSDFCIPPEYDEKLSDTEAEGLFSGDRGGDYRSKPSSEEDDRMLSTIRSLHGI